MNKVIVVVLLTVVYLIWIRYFEYDKTSDSWLVTYSRQLSYYLGSFEVLSCEEKRYEHVGCMSTYYTFEITYLDYKKQMQKLCFNSKLKPFEHFILEECKRITLEQFRSLTVSDAVTISQKGYLSEEDYYDKIQSFSLLSLTTVQPCNFFVFFPTVYLVITLVSKEKESELNDYIHNLLHITNNNANCIVNGNKYTRYLFHGEDISCDDDKDYEALLLQAS